MRRVAIIGLGLIGGSIGLALKRTGPRETELVGYVRSPEAADKALRLAVVDRVRMTCVSLLTKQILLSWPPQ